MTENEKKMFEQMYEMLCEMEKKVDRIGDSIDRVNGKETSTSVEGKLGDLQSVHKGLQATFKQGFDDVHRGLAEIKEVTKSKRKEKKHKGQLN
ncbi:chromosome segregation protein SMC [Bacillus thuringiensis]|nr:chromosome segregation protein SMC [Bacillus thuringiensis]